MLSGTRFRGDFEERLNGILSEAVRNPDIILFFDEMHTLIDNGMSESGGMSGGDMVKPLLARGSIRVIGATTVSEYRKYVEKDSALARRFQPIMVEEPTIEQTIQILTGLKDFYQHHHNIRIEDDAICAAAELSARYIPERQLPDKAIDIIDEAACKLSLNGAASLNKTDIEDIISEITGIPAGAVNEDESIRLLELEKHLHHRVIGQDKAISALARSIRRNRTGLSDSSRPVGSFLFLGPTGVGKTELSLALSDALYPNKNSIIRMDMSEYSESISVSKIIGSAPGYVGFDSCQSLTDTNP